LSALDRDATNSCSAFKKFDKTITGTVAGRGTGHALTVSPLTLDFSKTPIVVSSPQQFNTITSYQSPTLSAFYNSCPTLHIQNNGIAAGGSF